MCQLKVLCNYDIPTGQCLGVGPPMIIEVSVTFSVLFQGRDVYQLVSLVSFQFFTLVGAILHGHSPVGYS